MGRDKSEPGENGFHRFVGRSRAKNDAVQFLFSAEIEHRLHQFSGGAGAPLRRTDIDAVEVGIGFLGDEILPLADIGPADDPGVVLRDGDGIINLNSPLGPSPK